MSQTFSSGVFLYGRAGIDESLDIMRKIESRKKEKFLSRSQKKNILISLSIIDFREWEDKFLFLL